MTQRRIDEVFGPGGLLAKVLAPDYEWRPQQQEMAGRVYRMLEDGGALLVEAPTGVGKSLSYLVPGLLWSLSRERPLLVSTYTKNLQDQILEKELPRIRRLIDRRIRVAVLKGRANYLCRNRWKHFVEEVEGTNEGERVVRALAPWVESTLTGDLSEAPSLAERDRAALRRICGESGFCSTSRCTPDSGCYYKRSRREARESHLIIINHALLLADLFGAGGGLPEWDAIVIDEAHHLPRVAAEPLTYSVSERGLEAALKSLGGRGEPGVTEELRKVLRLHAGKEERRSLLERIRELENETGRLLELARSFWVELRASPSFPRPEERTRYGPNAPVVDLVPQPGYDLARAFAGHLAAMRRLADTVGALSEESRGGEPAPVAWIEAQRGIEEQQGVLAQLEELLTPSDRDRVYWIEPAGAHGISLKSVPLEVGPYLRDRLFRVKSAVVLTSATLAVHDRFTHVARKLGLDADGFEGLLLPTPFHLESQVQAWILTGIPDPNQEAFPEELARGIVLLARRLRRKMLVLFTSHDALRKVAERAREPLEATGIRLLAQGLRSGRRTLRSDFAGEGPAVLLGTASFWEGVDFPGEELEILVMARLPFLVPTDPLVEAMAERIQAEGGDPFSHFYLPEALIRFRQGFGRLIRRRGDRGLFLVVDPRMQTRSYGAQYRRSVGVPFGVAASWEEVEAAGRRWFGDGPREPTV